jgi:hypothetical protein
VTASIPRTIDGRACSFEYAMHAHGGATRSTLKYQILWWRRNDKRVPDIRLPSFRSRKGVSRKAFEAYQVSGLARPRSNTWCISKISRSSS